MKIVVFCSSYWDLFCVLLPGTISMHGVWGQCPRDIVTGYYRTIINIY